MIIDVAEASQVAQARRAATEMARGLTSDETTIGRIGIVASEMATNLLKHAPGGRIVAEVYADAAGKGVELLSLDAGAGIADLDQAMTDGYSSSGTSGGGLGAIRRQADHFAIFSKPDRGTAVLARISIPEVSVSNRSGVTIGAVHAPIPGETVSGDSWAFAESELGPAIIMIDGSGHGPLAESAARTAVDIFMAHSNLPSVELFDRMHRGIAHTRGGAVAIARIDRAAGLIRFTGVGNISAAVASEKGLRRMISHNGTVGSAMRRLQEFTYPFSAPALVLLHSDGLSAKWDLNVYPGLATGHPSLAAGVLFRDFWRGRDDGLIVALRVE
jgi:anti-sigma regulatory factor (Ser/Thr protein kinase)